MENVAQALKRQYIEDSRGKMECAERSFHRLGSVELHGGKLTGTKRRKVVLAPAGRLRLASWGGGSAAGRRGSVQQVSAWQARLLGLVRPGKVPFTGSFLTITSWASCLHLPLHMSSSQFDAVPLHHNRAFISSNPHPANPSRSFSLTGP